MAFDSDDLKFTLSPEVDVAAIERYLSTVEDKATKAGKCVAASLSEGLSIKDLSAQHGELEKIGKLLADQHVSLSKAKGSAEQLAWTEERITLNATRQLAVQVQLQKTIDSRPEVARAESIEQATKELEKQQDLLKNMVALADPKHLAQRLELEKQISEIRSQQRQPAAMQAASNIRQQGGQQLDQLAVQSDPNVIREQVQQENLLADARERYNVALEKERNNQAEPIELPTALDARAETLKQVTAELVKQRQELERQRLLLDPSILSKRLEFDKEAAAIAHETAKARMQSQLDPAAMAQAVLQERELAELQERVSAAKQAEQERQVPTKEKEKEQGKFDVKGLLEGFSQSGLIGGIKNAVTMLMKDMNIPQLLAGSLGALGTGSVKGAAGAAVGGVIGANVAPPTLVEPREQQRKIVSQQSASLQPPQSMEEIRNRAERWNKNVGGVGTKEQLDQVDSREQIPQKKLQLPQREIIEQQASQLPTPQPRQAIQPPPDIKAPPSGTGMSGGTTGASKIGGQAAGEVGGAAAAGGVEAGVGAAAGIGMEAAAGPIGLAIVAAQAIVKVSGQLAAAPFQVINAGLLAVDTGLKGLQGTLGPIGAGLDLASHGLKGAADTVKSIPVIGNLFGPLLDQLAILPGAIKSVTESLVSMAAKASPGQFHLFEMAVDDVQGVIGQSFLPVLAMMRDGVRLFGDVLATILPNANEVTEALRTAREAFNLIGSNIRASLGVVGGEIRDKIISGLTAISQVVADSMPFISKVVVGTFNAIAAAIEYVKPYFIGAIDTWSGIGSALASVYRTIEPLMSGLFSIINPLKILGAIGSAVGSVISGVAGFLGTMFSPLTEGLGAIKDAVGGVFSTIGEVIGTVWDTIKELFSGVRGMFSEFFEMLNPLKVVGDVFKLVASKIMEATVYLRNFLTSLGLVRPAAPTASTGTDPRSSQGAAARPAKFDSIEGYQQQLQQAAYSSGAQSPELMVASNQLITQNSILETLRGGIVVRINQAINQVANSVPQLAGTGSNEAALVILRRMLNI